MNLLNYFAKGIFYGEIHEEVFNRIVWNVGA
jgi:hypothetical protein